MNGTKTNVVLLIDDQLIIAQAVQQMIAGESDIEFHYCDDPKKAVAMVESVSPTVILQDLIMPQISGLELVKLLREKPHIREIPLVVLSTKEEPTIKAEAFALGANDYIVKLPDRLELLARIRYHSNAFRNLQERRAAFEQLGEQVKLTAEANRVKGELMTLATRELKNPLSGIVAYAEMLEKDPSLSEDSRRHVEKIKAGATRMSKLVSDLVQTAKQESTNMGMRFTEIALSKILQKVIEDNMLRASAKDQMLEFFMEEECVVLGDEGRLHEIFDQIVSNAIKYSPPECRTTVRMVKKGKDAQISVLDQGPGMMGTAAGAGLSTVSQLVDLHGGTIHVRSDGVGAGSDFTVRIPLASKPSAR